MMQERRSKIHWTPGPPGPLRVASFLLLMLLLSGCDGDRNSTGPGTRPAAPRNFDAFYHDHAVHLSWELGPSWNGESFAVYGRRSSDSSFFRIAEVTSCQAGSCSYRDSNVSPDVTYVYFVSAVGSGGRESPSSTNLEVYVPEPLPPPAPGGLDAVALDGATFLRWDDRSRDADDFSFYRVYLEGGETVFLLGETDSEGYLDLLAQNGVTYGYFVTAVDDLGHESGGSALASATPRPDFHGEYLLAFDPDSPDGSGFRFPESEVQDPRLPGDDGDRDFRLEFDQGRWWLAPGPDAAVYSSPTFTTALRCGPAADVGCVDVRRAPEPTEANGYQSERIELFPENAYVLRVESEEGTWYGLVRVTHLGIASEGAIAIFDWAFQLQSGNLELNRIGS